MSSINSTYFTSFRKLFKELSEDMNKLLTLLFGLITSTNSLFMKQHKQIMFVILAIVLYYLLVIIGTILQVHKRSLLPIIVCAIFVVGGVVSFLALSIFSLAIAIINLALWIGIFTFFVYEYVVAQMSSGLLPL